METQLEMLEQRLDATESELARVKRRVRATWTCAFVGAVGACALGANPEVRAQFAVPLDVRVAALENKTNHMTEIIDPNTGKLTIRFSGVNVQIVDGTNTTDGPVNGLGNLIVGYNELRGAGDNREGSHNLIVGRQNNYESYGGIVVGETNTIRSHYASVSGGAGNLASGGWSLVSGGWNNTASGNSSSVHGGKYNQATYQNTSVSGGQNNTAIGLSASVSGGNFNIATGDYSSVSGGLARNSTGAYDWRAGGSFQEF